MMRSRARRTRCTTLSKLSPPGGLMLVSRNQLRMQVGIALGGFAEGQPFPVAEVRFDQVVVDRDVEPSALAAAAAVS